MLAPGGPLQVVCPASGVDCAETRWRVTPKGEAYLADLKGASAADGGRP
jgi:hypothetical protein